MPETRLNQTCLPEEVRKTARIRQSGQRCSTTAVVGRTHEMGPAGDSFRVEQAGQAAYIKCRAQIPLALAAVDMILLPHHTSSSVLLSTGLRQDAHPPPPLPRQVRPSLLYHHCPSRFQQTNRHHGISPSITPRPSFSPPAVLPRRRVSRFLFLSLLPTRRRPRSATDSRAPEHTGCGLRASPSRGYCCVC